MSTLTQIAEESDRAVREARQRLVEAVRAAAAGGMTQHQIAAAIGRSQPEVSRLLRFQGAGPLARKLRAARPELIRTIKSAGGAHVRVFGSVATGRDRPDSDIDLLFTMTTPLSLMELAALEQRVAEVVGAPVDLVPDSSIRPDLRERILSEAVPL